VHSLFATTVLDHDAFGSFLGILVPRFLPVFALAAGLMAVIWIGCTVIVISGYLIGAVIVFAARAVVHTCAQYIRRQRDIEYAQLVTVDADGAHSKIVNLDRYRRRRQRRCSDGEHSNASQPHPDDDPA
jgi:hypothetical protein